MMAFVGIAMMMVGWWMLTKMGATPEQVKNGRSTRSDVFATLLLIVGGAIVVVFGLWQLGCFLWGESSHLFYDASATYAHMTIWDQCATGCLGAACFFGMSMVAYVKSETKHRQWRQKDVLKAGQMRDRMMRYSQLYFRGGMILLFAMVGCALVKGP